MIAFKDVTLIYDGKPLMKHFTETICEGEKVVFYGASGTGKSTLLSTVAGLVIPDDGVIEIQGKPVGVDTVNSLRQLMAWVPQEFSLPYQYVKECVEAPFLLRSNRKNKPAEKDILSVFGKLGLASEIYTKRLIEISGGQRQRVMIAIALLLDKAILLLDEPTSALDSESIGLLIDVLRSVEGKTVVAVSHDERFIHSFDRAVRIGGEL